MMSIPKLVVLFFVALGIWHLLNMLKNNGGKNRTGGPPPPNGFPPPPNAPTIEAVDLVKCPRCGAYVAPDGSQPCERTDCPGRR